MEVAQIVGNLNNAHVSFYSPTMMNYQAPPIPSRPFSSNIQISNVKEGETVYQV